MEDGTKALCSLGFEGSAVPGVCVLQTTHPISLLAAATDVLAEVALKYIKGDLNSGLVPMAVVPPACFDACRDRSSVHAAGDIFQAE